MKQIGTEFAIIYHPIHKIGKKMIIFQKGRTINFGANAKSGGDTGRGGSPLLSESTNLPGSELNEMSENPTQTVEKTSTTMPARTWHRFAMECH